MAKKNPNNWTLEDLSKALLKYNRVNNLILIANTLGGVILGIAPIFGRPLTTGELILKIGGNRYGLGGFEEISAVSNGIVLESFGLANKYNTVKLKGKDVLSLIKTTNFNSSNFDDLALAIKGYLPYSKIKASDLEGGGLSNIADAIGAGLKGYATGKLIDLMLAKKDILNAKNNILGTSNNSIKLATASNLAAFGGLIMGAIGTAASAIGSIHAHLEAKKLAEKINKLIDWANEYAQRSMDNNANNLISDQKLNALNAWNTRAFGGPFGYLGILSATDYAFMNDWLANLLMRALSYNKLDMPLDINSKFAEGGNLINSKLGGLHTNGSSWSDGMTTVNTGLSHELNPNEGVPMGVDNEGTPNLVELDETIYNDYVYSDRLTVPKLPKNIKKGTMHKLNTSEKEVAENSNRMLKRFEGMTYAKASKLAEKISGVKERPNDPIAKRGFEAMLAVLAESLEMERQKELIKELQKAIALMSPEELQLLLMAMLQEALLQLLPLMSPEELAMYEQLMALLMSPELQAAMLLLAMLELLMLLIPQLLLVDNQGLPIVAAYGGRLFAGGSLMPDDEPDDDGPMDYSKLNPSYKWIYETLGRKKFEEISKNVSLLEALALLYTEAVKTKDDFGKSFRNYRLDVLNSNTIIDPDLYSSIYDNALNGYSFSELTGDYLNQIIDTYINKLNEFHNTYDPLRHIPYSLRNTEGWRRQWDPSYNSNTSDGVDSDDLSDLNKDSTATTTGASTVTTGTNPPVGNTNNTNPVVAKQVTTNNSATNSTTNNTSTTKLPASSTYGLTTDMLSGWNPDLLEILGEILFGKSTPISTSIFGTVGEKNASIENYKKKLIEWSKDKDLNAIYKLILDYNPAKNWSINNSEIGKNIYKDDKGNIYDRAGDNRTLAKTLYYTLDGDDSTYVLPPENFKRYYTLGNETPIEGKPNEFVIKLTRKALPDFNIKKPDDVNEEGENITSKDRKTFDTSDYPLPNTNSYKAAFADNLINSIVNAVTPLDNSIGDAFLARSNRGFTPVAAKSISGTKLYTPIDRRADIAEINLAFNNTARTMLNSGSNAATVNAAMLANDFNRYALLSKARGEFDKIDRDERNKVIEFNSAIDLANAELGLKAGMANLEALYRITAANDDMFAKGMIALLEAKKAKEDAINASKSANLALARGYELELYNNDLMKWWLSHVGEPTGFNPYKAKGGKLNKKNKRNK